MLTIPCIHTTLLADPLTEWHFMARLDVHRVVLPHRGQLYLAVARLDRDKLLLYTVPFNNYCAGIAAASFSTNCCKVRECQHCMAYAVWKGCQRTCSAFFTANLNSLASDQQSSGLSLCAR